MIKKSKFLVESHGGASKITSLFKKVNFIFCNYLKKKTFQDGDKLEKSLTQLRDKYAYLNQTVFEEIERSMIQKHMRYLYDVDTLISDQINIKRDVY